jgi:hypothetical protein
VVVVDCVRRRRPRGEVRVVEIRAGLLHREGLLLRHLAGRTPGPRLPEVVALNDDPVVVVTRRLHGEPLSWGAGSNLWGHPFRCRGERLGPVPRRPSSPSGRRARRSVTRWSFDDRGRCEGARVQPPVGTAVPRCRSAFGLPQSRKEPAARGRQGQLPGS